MAKLKAESPRLAPWHIVHGAQILTTTPLLQQIYIFLVRDKIVIELKKKKHQTAHLATHPAWLSILSDFIKRASHSA